MVFNMHFLPVESQLEIYQHLPRTQLERLCLVNYRLNLVVGRYEHRLAHNRLTMVITGQSQQYRLHNFDVARMREVGSRALRPLLRNARIEYILITEDRLAPLACLHHLPPQLARYRHHWTGAIVNMRHMSMSRRCWEPVLKLFANARLWYIHAVSITFPVHAILASHHRHRVAEARFQSVEQPTAELFEYLRLPRHDGGVGRRIIVSEGDFNAYQLVQMMIADYQSLESPPPGPYAIVVTQQKEQWHDYRYYNMPLRRALLFATGPRNPRARGSLHFVDDHQGVCVVYMPRGRGWYSYLLRLCNPAHHM